MLFRSSGTGNISVRYLGIPASGVTTTAYRTVTEFTATAGQTTFTPPSYTVGFINVYRNGALLGSADYTATNGTTVVLASAATSGDLVTVESFLVSSVLNAIPATAGSVGSTYIAAGAVGTTQLASGAVGTTQLASGAVTQSILGTNVAGNGPSFSAYLNTSQTISANTGTTLQANTEEWDTGGCYNNTGSTVTLNGLSVPAYSFCPNIAGYYQINVCISFTTSGSFTRALVYISKNASTYKRLTDTNSSINTISGTSVVYLNGTGDYVTASGYMSASGTLTFSGASGDTTQSWFNGAMVRSA